MTHPILVTGTAGVVEALQRRGLPVSVSSARRVFMLRVVSPLVRPQFLVVI
jgi:hypothetical protein